MATAHTERQWRKVVSRSKIVQTWRGQGSARYETLECGHDIRVTGDKALALASRRICQRCQKEADRAARLAASTTGAE